MEGTSAYSPAAAAAAAAAPGSCCSAAAASTSGGGLGGGTRPGDGSRFRRGWAAGAAGCGMAPGTYRPAAMSAWTVCNKEPRAQSLKAECQRAAHAATVCKPNRSSQHRHPQINCRALTSSRQGSAELAVCTKSVSCSAVVCSVGATRMMCEAQFVRSTVLQF